MRHYARVVHVIDFMLVLKLRDLVVGHIFMLPDDAQLRQESIPLGPYGLLSLHVPLQLVVLLDESADDREGGCLG